MNLKKNKCSTKWCRTPNKTKNKICAKCQSRIYKEKYPERDIYYKLKANAKRRGKVFTLTIEELTEFLTSNPEYMKRRGRGKRGLHIDRIDESRGYEAGNLQILVNGVNSAKYRDFAKDCPF